MDFEEISEAIDSLTLKQAQAVNKNTTGSYMVCCVNEVTGPGWTGSLNVLVSELDAMDGDLAEDVNAESINAKIGKNDPC